MGTRPLILVDPHPRTKEMVWDDATARACHALGEVVEHWGSEAPAEVVEPLLPDLQVIVGQTAMDAARLARAPRLRAIVNVRANWLPNIDYQAAARQGVHVLSTAPAMAPAVAEWTLAAWLDLGRGLTRADRAFRAGTEGYGIAGTRDSVTLRGATIGLVGFGNLGRALLPLLRPFDVTVLAHDPFLSTGHLASQGVTAMPLPELLAASTHVAILAGATADNAGFLDRTTLAHVRPGCAVVLASRAAVVDFDALVDLARTGRCRLAVDVYPAEPVAADSPWRTDDAVLWSSHRAGADSSSYALMREMVVDDVTQILAGLPPSRLQRADPARAARDTSI